MQIKHTTESLDNLAMYIEDLNKQVGIPSKQMNGFRNSINDERIKLNDTKEI